MLNYLRIKKIKNKEKMCFHYLTLTNQLSFSTYFQNVNQCVFFSMRAWGI